MEKIRHHHYVWRYYLRPWASNEKIACLREGKIFKTNPMGVAQKRDFYKLQELNSDELVFIKRLAIDTAPKFLQESHTNLVRQFNIVFKLRGYIESKGINDQELNNLLDAAIHNGEEYLHTYIERTAIKYIKSILREDTEFYNTDEGCWDFIYFLCMQYVRTKKVKESIIEAVSNITTINFEKVCNILNHIFATNMGSGFYAERKLFKMVLLKNEAAKEFITGDQPVINTYGAIGLSKTPTDDIELYYPVSPKLAILISEKEEYKGIRTKLLNENDVVSYNNLILKNSHSQVYATSVSVLEEYNR